MRILQGIYKTDINEKDEYSGPIETEIIVSVDEEGSKPEDKFVYFKESGTEKELFYIYLPDLIKLVEVLKGL